MYFVLTCPVFVGPVTYVLVFLDLITCNLVITGNTVLLKPSDLAVNVSNLMVKLIPQYLDKVYIYVAVDSSITHLPSYF